MCHGEKKKKSRPPKKKRACVHGPAAQLIGCDRTQMDIRLSYPALKLSQKAA